MKKIICIIIAAVVVAGAITGVCLYFSKEKKGGEDKVSVTATFSDFTLYDAMFDYVDKYPERYGNEFVNYYGMDKKTADNMLEHPEEWLAFNVFITVHNNTENDTAIFKIRNKDVGKNGIFIRGAVDGTFQVVNGNTDTELCVPVLIHNSDPSLKEVYEMVKKLNIEIGYGSVPDDLEQDFIDDIMSFAKVRAAA